MATKAKTSESPVDREVKELEDRLAGYAAGNQTPYTELKQKQLTAKIARLRGKDAPKS